MSEYLTFPIVFLNDPGFNIKRVIDKAFLFCLYERCYYEEIDLANFEEAEDYVGVEYHDKEWAYLEGKRLFDQLEGAPKTSVRRQMLWDFNNNEKTEDEINSFFAFMAIRSIIQRDPCKKITNNYLLSRMAGHAKKGGQLPDRLKKYNQRYWIDKLKSDLRLTWHVKMYGRHTRGTYMSFTMTKEDLMRFVEKRRKKNRLKELAEEDKAIRLRVLAEINNHKESNKLPPHTSTNVQHL
jgi:hypothetical protein